MLTLTNSTNSHFPLLFIVLLPSRSYHASNYAHRTHRRRFNVHVAEGHPPFPFHVTSIILLGYVDCLLPLWKWGSVCNGYRLAQVCNATPTDTLQTQMHALYIAWTNSSKLHLTMYRNMRLQSFVWLNAPIWPQNDVVGCANDTVVGFGTTPRSCFARRKLFHLRRSVHYA